MQNLRDKLLKAGAVDKKQKHEADVQARAAARAQGGARQVDEARQRAQEEAHAARQAEVRAQAQAAEAELRSERAQQEHANQVRMIVARWQVRERPGGVRFHFVSRSGRIRFLEVSQELAHRLEQGLCAVVERPGTAEHLVIQREGAQRLLALDREVVRFWNGPAGAQVGVEDPPGDGQR